MNNFDFFTDILDLSFKPWLAVHDSLPKFSLLQELHICGTSIPQLSLQSLLLSLSTCHLRSLYLSSNPTLHRIPHCISKLESLVILGLGACRLEELCSSIGCLNCLEELLARDNRIDHVAESVMARFSVFNVQKCFMILLLFWVQPFE